MKPVLSELQNELSRRAEADADASTPRLARSRTCNAEAALPQVARRRRVRSGRRPALARTLAVLGLFAVAGGAVLTLATGQSGTLSIVEEAQAALESDGGILHAVTVIDAAHYVNGKRARRAGK